MKNSIISEYHSFIHDVDSLCSHIRELHGSNITCRKGCSDCCIGISVFPVEWFSVRSYVRRAISSGRAVPIRPLNSCVFLADGSCSVYAARPLICRTHGLPLTYRVEEYDDAGLPILDSEPDRQLVLCELNFPGMDEGSLTGYLQAGTTIDMEILNERLVILNRKFLETAEGTAFGKHERLPLATAIAGLDGELSGCPAGDDHPE